MFLVGLSLLLVVSFVSLPRRGATGSERAELGFSLGEVLLRWRLVSSGFVSPENQMGEDGLPGALNQLKSSLADSGFPEGIVKRVKPLEDKLVEAENRFLWPIQLGYWGFSQSGPSVQLSGAKVESISEDARFQSYRYLAFPNEEAGVTVDITEKSLGAGSEKFTVELWVNPAGTVSGTLLKVPDWSLVLEDNGLVLDLPQGRITGTDLTSGNWSHVALVTDGQEITVYQNGLATVSSGLSEPLRIPEKLQLGGGYRGKLDELRLKTKAIGPEGVSFDRPLDYLLGFPVIGWVNENFGPDERWDFYAGLLVSSLSVKGSSEMATIKPENLKDASDFLLGRVENVPAPPEVLPTSVQDDITQLGELGKKEELSEEDMNEVDEILSELVNFLGLS